MSNLSPTVSGSMVLALSDAPQDAGAIIRIARVAMQQLDLLTDAKRRRDADVGHLSGVALEVLLDAIADEAQRSGSDEMRAFAERYRASQLERIDARQHLITLGEGWSCKHCKNDVVGSALIDGSSAQPKLQLRCKACGRVTPSSKFGVANFKKKFGHLVGPDWDPTDNGFLRED